MSPLSPAHFALNPWRAAAFLAYRELLRFFRQRNRVIGAVGQPIIFWLLFGAGLSRSFSLSTEGAQQTFLEYYFPGTLVLILLFTAIFASISIIEDRREGFLQGVLVSPAPAWSMVLGKVGGGAAIALLQALLFLILGLCIHVVGGGWLGVLGCLALLAIIALSLSALGFFLAWLMDSTQGFHAIMSVLLFPMWLLSGAFFPIPSATSDLSSIILHWLMRLNPLSYGVAGVRQLLFPGVVQGPAFWQPSLPLAWVVSVTFLLIALVAASLISKRRIAGDIL